ncbi:hypothetical protein IJ707_02240 [bacterium]|nr:hypothetical protein [bacterium]
MTSAISAISGGLSWIDAINGNSKDDKEKSSAIEDIFSEILDEISENIEKQMEKTLKAQETESNNIQLGPPAGLEIEGFEYY